YQTCKDTSDLGLGGSKILFVVRSLHKLLIKESLTCHVEMNHDMVTNSVVIKRMWSLDIRA
ncbi:MAG: hypothetical protein WCE99_12680, partial [Nitrososphaeraceae archaeon]